MSGDWSNTYLWAAKRCCQAILCLVLQLGPLDAGAHHSFAGAYDFNKPVKLEGTIVRMEWINPHSLLHFQSKRPNGKFEEWIAEVGAPNALVRLGLNKQSFSAGTKIVVSGFRARDGSNKMNGQDIPTMDGKPLFKGGDR
jgi:hypothetical protein